MGPIRDQGKTANDSAQTSTRGGRDDSNGSRDVSRDDSKEGQPDVAENIDDEPSRFPPEQEASLLAEAYQHKAEANALFARGQADAALTAYEAAVAVLPAYLYYDLAILRSNMAACHLKVSAWQEAIRSATLAIEALDKRPGEASQEKEGEKQKEDKKEDKKEKEKEKDAENDSDVEEEIVSAGAAKSARPPPPPPSASLPPPPPTEQDRLRIRAKALLRRGRARTELGGWANLAGAEEDYKALAACSAGVLGGVDQRLVAKQIRELPAKTSAAKEAEMGDMMGKLKELGNGLLRPFGFSTDNFQMVKDEKTGGYSVNFRQGP